MLSERNAKCQFRKTYKIANVLINSIGAGLDICADKEPDLSIPVITKYLDWYVDEYIDRLVKSGINKDDITVTKYF